MKVTSSRWLLFILIIAISAFNKFFDGGIIGWFPSWSYTNESTYGISEAKCWTWNSQPADINSHGPFRTKLLEQPWQLCPVFRFWHWNLDSAGRNMAGRYGHGLHWSRTLGESYDVILLRLTMCSLLYSPGYFQEAIFESTDNASGTLCSFIFLCQIGSYHVNALDTFGKEMTMEKFDTWRVILR